MGRIAHTRNQFKSFNTYDYIITFINHIREKKTLLTLWEFIGSSFEQTWIPFTQGWLKLVQWFWRRIRRFLNFINICSIFRNISTWKRVWPFMCTNLNPHHPRMLYAKFGLKFAHWLLRRRCKCETLMTTTTAMTMDNGQIVIRKANLSLRFRWAKIKRSNIKSKQKTYI